MVIYKHHEPWSSPWNGITQVASMPSSTTSCQMSPSMRMWTCWWRTHLTLTDVLFDVEQQLWGSPTFHHVCVLSREYKKFWVAHHLCTHWYCIETSLPIVRHQNSLLPSRYRHWLLVCQLYLLPRSPSMLVNVSPRFADCDFANSHEPRVSTKVELKESMHVRGSAIHGMSVISAWAPLDTISHKTGILHLHVSIMITNKQYDAIPPIHRW